MYTTQRDRVNRMVGKWNANKRSLPAYAFPGGYQIVYYDNDGSPLCPDCASKALADFLEMRKDCALDGYLYDYYSDLPQYSDIYYEGPSMFCAECNTELESEYGDPWEEES